MIALEQPRAVARGDLPAPLRLERRACRRVARSHGGRSPTRACARSPSPYCSRSSPTPAGRLPHAPTRRCADASAFAHASAATPACACSTAGRTTCSRVGGYAAWRVGGMLAIFAGVWGVLAAVRALRAEEDAGRTELVLAGTRVAPQRPTSPLLAADRRRRGDAVGWPILAGLLAGALPLGGSAYLALATVAPAVVFAGVGALASQLAPTRRVALELGSAVLVAGVAAARGRRHRRGPGMAALGDAARLGEELRAFTGTHAAVLALPLGATALLLLGAGAIALRRDVGNGLLRARDRRAAAPARCSPRPPPWRCARSASASAAWLFGTGFFALIVGADLDEHLHRAGISGELQRQLQQARRASRSRTPAGYIGFSLPVLRARRQPVRLLAGRGGRPRGGRGAAGDAVRAAGRSPPLARRAAGAGARRAAVVIALAAGALAWAGRGASEGAGVSLVAACSRPAPTACRSSLLFLGARRARLSRSRRAPSAGDQLRLGAPSRSCGSCSAACSGAAHGCSISRPFEHVGLRARRRPSSAPPRR